MNQLQRFGHRIDPCGSLLITIEKKTFYIIPFHMLYLILRISIENCSVPFETS